MIFDLMIFGLLYALITLYICLKHLLFDFRNRNTYMLLPTGDTEVLANFIHEKVSVFFEYLINLKFCDRWLMIVDDNFTICWTF